MNSKQSCRRRFLQRGTARVGLALGAIRRVNTLILFVLSSSLAIAQLPTATILGVIRDSSGAVVPNTNLTARNVETGQSRVAVTGGDGSYRFPALPVGPYEINLEHPGFRSEVRRGLTLTVSQEAVVNFTLEVGSTEQTVEVTAEAPLLNTTSGSLGGLVNEQRVAELPLNGRNYIDLTLLQTGITQHENLRTGGGGLLLGTSTPKNRVWRRKKQQEETNTLAVSVI